MELKQLIEVFGEASRIKLSNYELDLDTSNDTSNIDVRIIEEGEEVSGVEFDQGLSLVLRGVIDNCKIASNINNEIDMENGSIMSDCIIEDCSLSCSGKIINSRLISVNEKVANYWEFENSVCVEVDIFSEGVLENCFFNGAKFKNCVFGKLDECVFRGCVFMNCKFREIVDLSAAGCVFMDMEIPIEFSEAMNTSVDIEELATIPESYYYNVEEEEN